MIRTVLDGDLTATRDPVHLCAWARRRGRAALLLDGGDGTEGWTPLVAIEPEPLLVWRRGREGRRATRPLEQIDAVVRRRRREGGTAGTGIALLLGFDVLAPPCGRHDGETPAEKIVALAVDASVQFPPGGRPVLTRRRGDDRPEAAVLQHGLRSGPAMCPPGAPTPPSRPPRTSLARNAYLRAVETVKEHIRRGDIYQANLTQRLSVPFTGDPLELYRRLCAAAPGPRSAFLEVQGLAVASVSPETFLRVRPDGMAETCPIKGTRPRGDAPREDAELARELLASPKDRAELLMIVDLERNDLGRVSRTGSVRVAELATLRSYPAVHHLVARVVGELRPDVGIEELIRATFPGGSVTGAPKIRALDILRSLEPVPRSFYTGCLFWIADDGSLESSILIRTVILSRGRALLGAGGGVVADSDPEEEWQESNHKARRLAHALGFDPEEAISASRKDVSG